MNNTRRKVISKLSQKISIVKGEIETVMRDIKGEKNDYKDNILEKLKGDRKYEVGMKEAFWNKLNVEYKSYQVSVLSLTNAEIYGKCNEVDCIVNFYEILMEKTESMSEETLSVLLRQENILWNLYDNWLAKDDSNYSEMEDHITEELKALVSSNNMKKVA